MVIPQHGTAFRTEAALGCAHLGGFVVLVELNGGDVDPWPSVDKLIKREGGKWTTSVISYRLEVQPYQPHHNSLDLVLAPDDIERLGISHDIDATHVSSDFPADGALAYLNHQRTVTDTQVSPILSAVERSTLG